MLVIVIGFIGGSYRQEYVAASWFSAMEGIFVLAIGAYMALTLVRGLSESCSQLLYNQFALEAIPEVCS